jgi:tetratricopeptide (TPR) repeat protein
MGSAAEGLRNYEEARQLTDKSLAIRCDIGDRGREAFGLNNLCVIVEMLEDYAGAIRLYHESLALFTELDEGWTMTLLLSNLGDVAASPGDDRANWTYYQQALAIALERWAVPQMLMTLAKIAKLLSKRGESEHGRTAGAAPALPGHRTGV